MRSKYPNQTVELVLTITKQKLPMILMPRIKHLSSLMMNNNEQVLEQSKAIILNKVLKIKY